MKRNTFLHLLPCFFTALAFGSCNNKKSKIILPDRGLCAHRGASETHPENTIAAFREAIRVGAHMIEFDVYITKDDELVVIHDSTVDRTTDGSGEVSDLTLEEIKNLDAGYSKSPEFKGERIPTLTETLSIMPVNIWLNVHLKGGEKSGKKVTGVINAHNRKHQAFLACNHEAAEGARSIDPTIMICNMVRDDSSWEYVDATIALKADFIQLIYPFKPEFSEYTKKLKEHGIRINYFGTDSYEEMRDLYDAGVEFPLVNNITAMMKEAEKLGIQPVKPLFRNKS